MRLEWFQGGTWPFANGRNENEEENMTTQRVRSVNELAERIARDPDLEKRIRTDPVKTIAGLAPPLQTDVWVYRLVAIMLGLVVLGAIIGGVVLKPEGEDTNFLVAIGSAAGGALTGLLAPGNHMGD